ncbi:MAG: beta-galactosidase domain 4-containing protein, partial [Cyclobacteriaceae bacterium]
KRPIIYPWLQRNKVDTYHYLHHNMGINRMSNGADVYMPTEFIHGLYDGGHGAGLDDYWSDFMKSPLVAGGFLWVFSDEAVVRTDKDGILDGDGNYAPDGILGPYREKEGSFYTIKHIWSPVQIKPITINENFDGNLFLENKYTYTNLTACTFTWIAIQLDGLTSAKEIASGKLSSPDIAPGETREVNLNLPANFAEADIFSFTATDHTGMEIYTWTWPIKMPKAFVQKTIGEQKSTESIQTEESGNLLKASVAGVEIAINLENGILEEVRNTRGSISFNGGPLPVGLDTEITGSSWRKESDGSLLVEITYEPYPKYVRWRLHITGMLHLEVAPPWLSKVELDYIGVTFNYPEELSTAVKWIGKGPYRVWKNRMKGAEFGLWEKAYNNTITGHSFESLIYPEFKGYHAGLYAMELQNKESNFKIYSETPNLFFKLYTPENSPHATLGVKPPFPEGDISFLMHIPPIGTKFSGPETMGPDSQKGRTGTHFGDEGYPISLWFDFK